MRLACLQGPGGAEPPLEQLRRAAADVRDAGGDLLACPEMFLTGYAIGREAVVARAEPVDGPSVAALREIAHSHDLALVAGMPLHVSGHVLNAAVAIDRDGTVAGVYAKSHLFGDLDRAQFDAGDAPPLVVTLAGLRVGLLICYDVEFPEAVRLAALAGADLVVVPTALMSPYEVVARTLIPARAYESQVFMAYINRCDREGELDYCGLTCVVGPDGRDIARAGGSPELLYADVDPAVLAASRAENHHLTDRRSDLYHPLARQTR